MKNVVCSMQRRWYGWLSPSRQERLRDTALLLLRLWFGGAMLVNSGWGKIFRLLENPSEFRDPLGIGPELSLALVVFAEVPCAMLVMLGLVTRLAAIPLIITMLVAGFVVHWFHISATSYLVAYVVLALMGPGRYSLDQLLWPRPKTELS